MNIEDKNNNQTINMNEYWPNTGLVVTMVSLIVLAISLSGCVRVKEQLVAEHHLKEIIENRTLEQQAKKVVSPHQSRNVNAVKPKSQKRFNVSVNNLPAKTFFLSLVADAGVNVVADPEMSGTISLELKNVTVAEVLDVARDVYGYEYAYDNNVYIIYPRKIRTEIFDVNYLNLSRDGLTETSVAISAISSGSTSEGSSEGESKGGGSGMQTKSTSGTKIVTKNSTDFWWALENTLNAIVGSSDGRSVIVNPHASVVVVKALPKELNRVRRFLNRAQLNVKRQIILETKILEVTLSDGYESGIHWEELGNQLLYTDNVAVYDSFPNILSQSNGGENFSSVVMINDIFKLLKFLDTQGSVQVLSSPRVSTVNNQKAIIRVGTDEFFVTGIKNNTTASAAATTSSPEIELTSFFSGISLDVTPQISANGDVILHVHPLVSSVVDQQKEFTIGSDEYDIPLALREVRESDSIVKARSGEIVVLGGLMQENSNTNDGKRPLLGDIPVLKGFFKTKSKKLSKKELVILMRPIVVDDNAWHNDIDSSFKRFQQLGQDYRRQE